MTPAVPEFMSRLSTFAQKWIVEKRSARMMARSTTPYEEIKLFYDEVFPHFPDMIAFLDEFEPGQLPQEAKPVLWLSLSVVECARCVELWRANDINAVDTARIKTYYE